MVFSDWVEPQQQVESDLEEVFVEWEEEIELGRMASFDYESKASVAEASIAVDVENDVEEQQRENGYLTSTCRWLVEWDELTVQ